MKSQAMLTGRRSPRAARGRGQPTPGGWRGPRRGRDPEPAGRETRRGLGPVNSGLRLATRAGIVLDRGARPNNKRCRLLATTVRRSAVEGQADGGQVEILTMYESDDRLGFPLLTLLLELLLD